MNYEYLEKTLVGEKTLISNGYNFDRNLEDLKVYKKENQKHEGLEDYLFIKPTMGLSVNHRNLPFAEITTLAKFRKNTYVLETNKDLQLDLFDTSYLFTRKC